MRQLQEEQETWGFSFQIELSRTIRRKLNNNVRLVKNGEEFLNIQEKVNKTLNKTKKREEKEI